MSKQGYLHVVITWQASTCQNMCQGSALIKSTFKVGSDIFILNNHGEALSSKRKKFNNFFCNYFTVLIMYNKWTTGHINLIKLIVKVGSACKFLAAVWTCKSELFQISSNEKFRTTKG